MNPPTTTIRIAFLVLIKSSPTSFNFLIKTLLYQKFSNPYPAVNASKNPAGFLITKMSGGNKSLKPDVKKLAAVISVFLPAHYIIERINREGIFFDYPVAADFQFVQCEFEMIHGDAHVQILDVDVS